MIVTLNRRTDTKTEVTTSYTARKMNVNESMFKYMSSPEIYYLQSAERKKFLKIKFITSFVPPPPKRIEYILEWNLLEKSVKRPFCFHTIFHIFVLNNLLGPGTSFYRKSKINIKRKPNYEIGWFHK